LKKDYTDDSWLEKNDWRYGVDDERGAANEITSTSILKAISLIKKGKVYDLETVRFKGMNIWNKHCDYEIVSYASPSRRRTLKNTDASSVMNWYKPGEWMDDEHNDPKYHMGCNTEMVIGPMHIGTHIDALCHWTTGEDDHWYNGYTDAEYGSSMGPTKCDASKIPPLIMRGVMLDIAAWKGMEYLPLDYIITAEDCEKCAKWENVKLKAGDAVMLRTGNGWPQERTRGAGLGISAARYLVEESGAILIGDDKADLDGENADGSMSVPKHPQPVHHYLLIQHGIHILEYVQLEELSNDKVYEFCFINCSPKFRNATGVPTRPIAII
jgi:kynurenine formamidase